MTGHGPDPDPPSVESANLDREVSEKVNRDIQIDYYARIEREKEKLKKGVRRRLNVPDFEPISSFFRVLYFKNGYFSLRGIDSVVFHILSKNCRADLTKSG